MDGQIAGLDRGHPTALAALDELLSDLKSASEMRVAQRYVSNRGDKGAWAELTVSLGSTSTIAAFVRIARLWLERDRHRSLTISISEHETGKIINITGERISVESLTEALKAAERPPRED